MFTGIDYSPFNHQGIKMNIYNSFLKTANSYPTSACISDDETHVSYSQMVKRIRSLSEKIVVPAHTCVILYFPKNIDLIAWQLALNSKEIIFLTLEWGQESRLIKSIEKIQPSATIMWNIEKKDFEIIYYPSFRIYPENCAYIVFSSGSTGEPKKIMLSDSPVIEVVLEQARITKMQPTSVFLWLLNPAFDASLSDIYMTLLSGGHLIASNAKPNELKKITSLIYRYNVSHTDLPPVIFSIFLKHVQKSIESFKSLKHIVFGGEKADEKIIHQLLSFFNLYNAYGPTETTICSSLKEVSLNWNSKDIGVPLKGVEYQIVDKELHIGGHCAIGYDDPLLDMKFYEKDGIRWFKTGDIVEKNDDTYHYMGRKDRQFKYHGQLICPEEIESFALESGAQLAKIKYENNKIIMYYMGNFSQEKLQSLIPSWMMPHQYILIEKMDNNINQNWKLVV